MYLWIDLETTGLDPRLDRILEVGWMVTNENFRGRSNIRSAVVTPTKAALGYITTDTFIHNMHSKSGLLEALMSPGTLVIEDVEDQILDALQDFPEDEPWYLAGASVHFDRGFIDTWMPRLSKKLHHRILDTSSLKLFASACGIVVVQLPQIGQHRVRSDIQYCFQYAQLLREEIGYAKR